MTQIVKTLNYTGTRQVLVWPAAWSTTLTAYLWGGGGGGGGYDAGVPGGSGTGGGFARKTFTVNGNDVIEISVGGAGGAGASNTRGGGGSAGAGLIAGDSFSAISYSGGVGGAAGVGRGASGAGGGSGGATVLRVNNIVIAVAGGGAGGGGAGVTGVGDGTAPGPNLNDTSSAGQNGGNQPWDGGGGGAGGGGFGGGNAGYWGGGSSLSPWNYFDATGQGGMYGTSYGDVTADPSGRNPGNNSSAYYPGSVARGGTVGENGQNGYAVVELAPNKVYVRNGGVWNLVNTVWVKNSGVWQSVQQLWIKQNGIWKPTLHSSAPDFVTAPSDFGVISRPAPTLQSAPDTGGGGSDYSGGGVSIF